MTNVKSIKIGNKDVYLVMREGVAIWPERSNLVAQFIANAKSQGYTIDEPLVYKSWQSLHPILKKDFSEALILGVYKTGSIAAMKNDGSIITYPFTRNSTKAYWDKDGKMKQAAVNVPTIDYDPLTRECKGYGFNRALTNSQTHSNLSNITDVNTGNAIYKKTATGWNLGELLDSGLEVTIDGANIPISYTVGNVYTVLFYIKMQDGSIPRIGAGATNDARLFLNNAYRDSAGSYQLKHIKDGVYRLKATFTATATSSNQRPILRPSSNDLSKKLVYSGLMVCEGDVSIDEPYIPTNGSIVTTVGDAAPRIDKPFAGKNMYAFYGDIEIYKTSEELLVPVVGAPDSRFPTIGVPRANLAINFNIRGNTSSSTSSLSNSISIGFNKIKLLSQYDAVRNPVSIFYYKNTIYTNSNNAAAHVNFYGYYIPAPTSVVPILYIKTLIAILDKNVTDSEGLEITS